MSDRGGHGRGSAGGRAPDRGRARAKPSAGLAATLACLLSLVPAGLRAQQGGGQPEESRVLQRARMLEQAGRADSAAFLLREYLARAPASVAALQDFVRLESASGRLSDALPLVERAVDSPGGASSPGLRQLWVRTLVETGATDSARSVAERWTRSRPDDALAYSELAYVQRRAGSPREAIATLERGRSRLGRPEAYVQELAELYASTGSLDRAAAAWLDILGWGSAGFQTVRRQLDRLPKGRQTALQALLAAAAAPDVGFEAARGVVRIAVDYRNDAAAIGLLQRLSGRIPADSWIPFLRDLALEARSQGEPEVERWCVDRLAQGSPTPGDRQRWQARAAELSLAAGDTSSARRTLQGLVERGDSASQGRETALRTLFELSLSDPDRAARRLEAYAREFPGSERSLAEMAVRLSGAYVDAGRLDRAGRPLELLPSSPGDAAVAARVEGQRAWIAFYRGHPGAALSHLQTPALVSTDDPGARSRSIELLSALQRADSADAAATGRVLLRLRERPGAVTADTLLAALEGSGNGPGRAALLALAANAFDDAGRSQEGTALREKLVQEHPQADEVPAALLRLGQDAAAQDTARARRWLQKLILEYPESAVTPLARRILARLEGQLPG